jgi:hypothetical protein
MVAGAAARSLAAAYVLMEPEIVRLGQDVLFRGRISDGSSKKT